MEILLNWFPPAFNMIPSPAMSILKGYLKQYGHNADILYWNFIMRDIILLFNRQENVGNIEEFDALVPFLAVLLDKPEEYEKFQRLALTLQTKNPQYVNIDREKYYTDLLHNASRAVVSRFYEVLEKTYSCKHYSLIGVSVKLLQLVPAGIFARISKNVNPNLPILAGGVANKNEAVALLENFVEYDYVIWGEGENPLHQLCRFLNGEITIEEVPNLVYRNGKDIKCTSKYNDRFSCLDGIKPDYSDFFKYYNAEDNMKVLIPLESSRGCHWGKCRFCFLTTGYKNRSKSNEAIVEEILSAINNYGIYEFIFLDNDIIFNDFDKFDDLLDKLINIKQIYEKFGIWNGEVVTKGLSAVYVKRMVLAGFKSIQIGYEAISDSLLRKIQKKNTFSSNLLFVKWANQYNLEIQGLNIITGLIGETDEDIYVSCKNLHFLRFYLKRNSLEHSIIRLQIMRTSRYFKEEKEKGTLHLWSENSLYSFFPDSYIKSDDRFDLMFFANRFVNPLWDNFKKLNDYYIDTEFSYKIYLIDEQTILYTELIDGRNISTLEFNMKEDFHWKILEFCNSQIRSLDSIFEYFSTESDIAMKEKIKEAIQELNSEFLLYSNSDFTENVSIINTDIIY